MALSRIELMRNDIKTALAGITTANGYRTDPREIFSTYQNPLSVAQHPSLAVVVGESVASAVSSTKQTWNEDVNVYVICYVRASDTGFGEESEKLISDVMKVLRGLIIINVNSTDNKYVFVGPQHIKTMRLPDMRNGIGFHIITTKARILYESFVPEASDGEAVKFKDSDGNDFKVAGGGQLYVQP